MESVLPAILAMDHWIAQLLDACMDGVNTRASGATFKEVSGMEFGRSGFLVHDSSGSLCRSSFSFLHFRQISITGKLYDGLPVHAESRGLVVES